MESSATALPSGLTIEELLDWRPEFGVLTVCVGMEPGDRSEGWLIELRNQLKGAVEPADDGHDRGRGLRAAAQRVLDRFEGEELPSGRCQIGFCEVSDDRTARDLWSEAQMDGFRTSASYADRARLTALLKLLDEGAPARSGRGLGRAHPSLRMEAGVTRAGPRLGGRDVQPRLARAKGWEALRRGPDPGRRQLRPRPVRPAARAQPGALPRGDGQADRRRGAESQLAESHRLRRSRARP